MTTQQPPTPGYRVGVQLKIKGLGYVIIERRYRASLVEAYSLMLRQIYDRMDEEASERGNMAMLKLSHTIAMEISKHTIPTRDDREHDRAYEAGRFMFYINPIENVSGRDGEDSAD